MNRLEIPAFVQRGVDAYNARMATPEGRAAQEKAERDEAYQQKEQDDLADQSRETARLHEIGIPRRIRRILKKHLNKTSMIVRVDTWDNLESDEWCLVLSGQKGTGKSVAAGWWLEKSGCPPGPVKRWWTAAELSVADWYSGDFAQIAEMSGPLVVDDLGTEFSDKKGFFAQRLDALVDARYREMLPTLITTNLAPNEFAKRYSERIIDRLRDGGSIFRTKAKSLRVSK